MNGPRKLDKLAMLRDHARRLREIATTHRTTVSPELEKIADELEARIKEMEKDL